MDNEIEWFGKHTVTLFCSNFLMAFLSVAIILIVRQIYHTMVSCCRTKCRTSGITLPRKERLELNPRGPSTRQPQASAFPLWNTNANKSGFVLINENSPKNTQMTRAAVNVSSNKYCSVTDSNMHIAAAGTLPDAGRRPGKGCSTAINTDPNVSPSSYHTSNASTLTTHQIPHTRFSTQINKGESNEMSSNIHANTTYGANEQHLKLPSKQHQLTNQEVTYLIGNTCSEREPSLDIMPQWHRMITPKATPEKVIKCRNGAQQMFKPQLLHTPEATPAVDRNHCSNQLCAVSSFHQKGPSYPASNTSSETPLMAPTHVDSMDSGTCDDLTTQATSYFVEGENKEEIIMRKKQSQFSNQYSDLEEFMSLSPVSRLLGGQHDDP